MIKVVILTDTIFRNYHGEHHQVFTKNASGLRLSHQLRKRGIEVKPIYNFLSFSIDEISEILTRFSENKKHQLIICLSTSFLPYEVVANKDKDFKSKYETVFGFNFEKIYQVCQLSKTKFNSTLIVGGWLVKPPQIEVLKPLKHFVDCFVVGDGVDFITKLALPNFSLNNDSGNFVKKDQYTMFISKDIQDFSEQSSSPIVDDFIGYNEALTTEIASGCIFSCSFCNYASLGKKKKEFVRSYESLKQEIQFNYENFGTRVYTLTDNIVNDYQPKLEMLIRIREELGIDLRWSGYVRLDTIRDRSQAQLLKDSGLASATMGIESLCKTAGPYIGKMTDGEIIKDKLRMCREIWKDDVIISAAMIAGLPTESTDILQKNFEFITSDEGLKLIDTHVYSRLILFPNQGTKNEINKGRMDGNPFNQYIKKENDVWTSPWGDSEIFANLANQFNRKDNSIYFAFNLPILHNLGTEVEDLIKTKRNTGTKKENKKELLESIIHNTTIKLNTYKQKMLSNE